MYEYLVRRSKCVEARLLIGVQWQVKRQTKIWEIIIKKANKQNKTNKTHFYCEDCVIMHQTKLSRQVSGSSSLEILKTQQSMVMNLGNWYLVWSDSFLFPNVFCYLCTLRGWWIMVSLACKESFSKEYGRACGKGISVELRQKGFFYHAENDTALF